MRVPSDAYYQLIRYIVDRNGYEVGDSGLYLNEYQPDPFKPCFKVIISRKGSNKYYFRTIAIPRRSASIRDLAAIVASVEEDSET